MFHLKFGRGDPVTLLEKKNFFEKIWVINAKLGETLDKKLCSNFIHKLLFYWDFLEEAKVLENIECRQTKSCDRISWMRSAFLLISGTSFFWFCCLLFLNETFAIFLIWMKELDVMIDSCRIGTRWSEKQREKWLIFSKKFELNSGESF